LPPPRVMAYAYRPSVFRQPSFDLRHFMKKPLHHLLVLALAIGPAISAFAADAKRVLVVTTTTGFRHSSIPYAEKTLEKLGKESGVYTVVDFARQPDIEVPRKPNKPKDLAANADDKAKAKYEGDMKKYNAELAKWTPEFEK